MFKIRKDDFLVLPVILLGILFMAGACTHEPSASDINPVRLTCESRVDPLGIDALHPRLSWNLQAGRNDQIQSAYQILVSTSRKNLTEKSANLWNSGKIRSNNSIQIDVFGEKTGNRAGLLLESEGLG